MASSSGAPPEPLFYAPIEGARPRQGEIVAALPWGIIESPLAICRPQGRPGAAAVHDVDKLDSAFKKSGIETMHARGGRSLGMIVWPDCELDKFMEQGREEDRWFAGVAPVMPLTRVQEDIRPGIRASRRRQYFYLPANDTLEIPESYVDLRHIWSVKQLLFKQRLVAISEAALAALHAQLFSFLSYQKAIEPQACPNCGTAIKVFEPDREA